jgi:predicted metalloprotease with PDZ domain
MWQYKVSSPLPSSRFVQVCFTAPVDADRTTVCLPLWRPGRYELGNFAKNVRDFKVTDENGAPLAFSKTEKSSWEIITANAKQLSVSFNYYAAQPDAGACWTDETLLYINPVHCMPYLPGELHTACELTIDVPNNWTIACGLPKMDENKLLTKDFHELVDSPFFAGTELQHDSYSVNGINFHIWIHGNAKPDFEKIKKDFEGFTKVQLAMMDSFPVKDYHFLILTLPYRFYHGVEHITSTVLALGPGYALMEPELYNDLMGVASHELFHVWNVKTLRPVDFNEYDYSGENYSRLGWVYEGFTTYYGDLFLARSGFFSKNDWFAEVNARFQKHFDNDARFRYSVADSSFDTWLDGYVPGIPYRKTNIYDEGSVIAMMLDLYIRRASQQKNSLDTLFKRLYNDFAPHHRGYREQDVKAIAIELSDDGVKTIFEKHIDGIDSYEPLLNELLSFVGCYVSRIPAKNTQEKCFGFKTIQEGGIAKVSTVYPGSLAEIAGLAKDDEIAAVNGWKVEGNLSDLLKLNSTVELIVFSQKKLKSFTLVSSDKRYFDTVKIESITDASEAQKAAFKNWTNLS